MAAGLFEVPVAVVPWFLSCPALVNQLFVAHKLAVPVVAESAVDIALPRIVVLTADTAVSQLVVVCLEVVVCTPAVVAHFAVDCTLLAGSAVVMGYMAAEMHWNVVAVPAEPPGVVLYSVAVVTKRPFVEPGLSAVARPQSGAAAALYLPAFVVLLAECSVAAFRTNLTSPAVASEQ